MKIADALPLIKTGDICLFRGRGPIAWAIKARTHSEYSHAGIALRVRANGLERVAVLESLEPFGVRVFPLDVYVQRGEDVDWFTVIDPTVNREKVASFALGQWGKRYAMGQVFASFGRLAWLFRLLLRKPSSVVRVNPERWFCSELVTAALQYAGWTPDNDDKFIPITTSPGDVALFTCLQRRGRLTP